MTDLIRETGGRSSDERASRLEAEVRRLQGALEDILTLAHSAGEPSARAVAMQRRAIAALSGRDAHPERSDPAAGRADAEDVEPRG